MELSSTLLAAIGKYLAGEAGAEEEQLVREWYHSFDDTEVSVPEQVTELRNKVNARLWSRLTGTINEAELQEAPVTRLDKRSPFIYRKALIAAVSIILLILAGGKIFFLRHQPEKVQTAARQPLNDVAPGGNKATLTLADGSRIALDSAHDGMVTRQGIVRVVKLNSGKIVYDVARSGEVTNQPVSYNTITTPRGGQFQITLPDGTNVWLNAATSLRYPTRFEGNERRVFLKGEAYFEVTKSPEKPFMVDMPDRGPEPLQIQVLGTNFNVNGYEDEAIIKTTLVEGAVKITQGKNTALLMPGQQAQANGSGGITVVRDADTEEALAWKNGLFQYNSTDLKAIMRQVARWYDVHIVYEGKMDDEFFSGSVPRTENASQLLHILAMTKTVHFTIEGKTIYVKP